MKRILFALSILLTVVTVSNAADFYNCVDSDGNAIITDNPPLGAKCGSPGGDDSALSGEKDSACSRIGEQLNNLESKSALTNSQRKQQTGLIEKLSLCDIKDNVLSRIDKILNVLDSKSALTTAEREQRTKLLSLKTKLSTSDAMTSGEQKEPKEIDTKVKNQPGDVESDQADRKADLAGRKAETKRLLSIPRLGY